MKKYLLPLALTLLLFTGACSYKVATVSKQSSDTAMVSNDSSQDDSLITTPAEVELTLKGPECHPGEPYCYSLTCPCCFVCIIPEPDPWERIVWPPEDPWIFQPDILYGFWVITPAKDMLMNQPPVKYCTLSDRLNANLKTWQAVGVNYTPLLSSYCGIYGYLIKQN